MGVYRATKDCFSRGSQDTEIILIAEHIQRDWHPFSNFIDNRLGAVLGLNVERWRVEEGRTKRTNGLFIGLPLYWNHSTWSYDMKLCWQGFPSHSWDSQRISLTCDILPKIDGHFSVDVVLTVPQSHLLAWNYIQQNKCQSFGYGLNKAASF